MLTYFACVGYGILSLTLLSSDLSFQIQEGRLFWPLIYFTTIIGGSYCLYITRRRPGYLKKARNFEDCPELPQPIEFVSQGIEFADTSVVSSKIFNDESTLSLHDGQKPQMTNDDSRLESESSNLEKPSKPPRHYCQHCELLQPYRTRHCHQCQACVAKFDHHCFWIGGCVGELNHRTFFLTLALVSLECFMTMVYVTSRSPGLVCHGLQCGRLRWPK